MSIEAKPSRAVHWITSVTLLTLLLCASGCQAAALPEQRPFEYEDSDVSMRLVIRSPEQLTAFYLGREFGTAAVEKILETCFFAAIIQNHTYDVLWLELDNWQFRRGDREISRLTRDYWPDKWRDVALPQRHQSTFGWTLLPEARDLRRDESVGGNLVLPMQVAPFTLIARFHTGADRQGPLKTIVFEDVTCPRDPD